MLWFFLVALSSVLAQHSSVPVQAQTSMGSSGNDGSTAYVNSGGLRLRDFPSIDEGRILAVLSDGQRLGISAVTGWKDRINGRAFPWYYVWLADKSDVAGWVYGEFISFQPGYVPASETVRTVSRQQSYRSLLVLQMFRKLLGTDSHEVATSWLRGLPEASAAQLPMSFPTNYSLRDYKSDFGAVIVRYNPQDKQQLVLSIALDRPRSGLLITIGEPIARVEALLGSDYYARGPVQYYRGIPGVDSYGVAVQSENGVVTEITASALLD